MTRKKALTVVALVAAVAVALVLVATAVLLLGDYDSDRLGTAVLGRLGDVLGLQLEAERFRLRPLRGLEIEGLRGTGSVPAGEVELGAHRLVLEHSLLSLLRGTVVVHRVRLEEPALELISRTPGGADPSPASPRTVRSPDGSAVSRSDGGAGLRLEIREIRLEEAALRAHPGTAPNSTEDVPEAVAVENLDLVLRDVAFDPSAPTPAQGWSAIGEARFERALLGETEVVDGDGSLSLADGRFRAEDFELRLDQGPARLVDFDVDLTRAPFGFQLSLTGSPLDTNRFLLAEDVPPEDSGLGASKLELSLGGRGADPATLNGAGSIAVEQGRVPPVPLFRAIDTLLSDVRLAGAPYEPFEIVYRVEGPRLVFEPARVLTESLVLTLESGWADLAGPLDLRMTLRAPRSLFEGVEEIPRELLDALGDEDGRVVLPFRIAGTLEEPSIAVDRSGFGDRLRRGLQNEVERRLRDEVTKGLRSLLGEEDDEPPSVEDPETDQREPPPSPL